jgi:hypothetical protein
MERSPASEEAGYSNEESVVRICSPRFYSFLKTSCRSHSEARSVPRNLSFLGFLPKRDSSLRLPAAGGLGMTH